MTFDPRFQRYLDKLEIKQTTLGNYRQYVRWAEQYGCRPFDLEKIKTEDDLGIFIKEVAAAFSSDPLHPNRLPFNERRKSDLRCILKHYVRFLESESVKDVQERLEHAGEFSPKDGSEGKGKIIKSIALRRGQRQFRDALLRAYEGRCAITGTSYEDALEAAHILPYNGRSTNHICNGLLLRADVHTLYDLKLISVDPSTLKVYCCEELKKDPTYEHYHGIRLMLPRDKALYPNPDALGEHFAKRAV